MKKLIITLVALVATFAAGTAQAGIFGWRNRYQPMQPAPVVVTPAPTTTAQAENGYRSFSYQPAPAYPAPTYGNAAGQPAAGNVAHDAGWKIRGF
jgi:hypothetical protein